jgi:putative ABC transport system permease protein
VNGVLLQPLPYAQPKRLVNVWEHSLPDDVPKNTVSAANFLAWRDQFRSIDRLALLFETSSTVTGAGDPERVGVAIASASYFDMVGAKPVVGRFYTEGEDVEGAERVVVLSEGYWRRRFGGQASVIGSTIALSGGPSTIVGVLPAAFDFEIRAKFAGVGVRDVWTPPRFGPADRQAIGRNYQVLGRLAPGATAEQAQREAAALALKLRTEFPQRQKGWAINVVPLHADMVGDMRETLLIAFGAVCFFLLIACANVANLLMTRATERQQEIAVRSALGAGRGRLIRQLLTESMLLSLIGAAIGVGLAALGLRALVAEAPDIPRMETISIDLPVLGFALLAMVVTALLFGLLPAFHIAGADVAGWLKERGTAGRRSTRRVRGALVVLQMALSLVLLIGAGLLVRSLINRLNVGVGLNTEHLLTAEVQLARDRYDTEQKRAQLFEQLIEQVRAIPGVQHASGIVWLPLTGLGTGTYLWRADRPAPEPGQAHSAEIRWIHRDYPQTMGIPVIAGRGFTEADRRGAPLVVLISEAASQEYFPGESPIGKHILMPWAELMNAEVVGVVGDVRHMGPDAAPLPTFYFEHRQFQPFLQMSVVVRTMGDPGGLTPALRAELHKLDPNLPLYNVRTMAELFSRVVARPRFTALSLGSFALFALVLAVIGTYAVMAYATQQRAQEIGIRVALGASRITVMRMVVGQGAALVAAALVIGTTGALLLTRLLKGMVYNLPTTDPLTFAMMAGLLAIAGVAACLLPARRASGIDPLIAMRRE